MAKTLRVLCALCILTQASAQTNNTTGTPSDSSSGSVDLAAIRQFAAMLTFSYGQSRLLSEKQQYYHGNQTYYQYIEAFPQTLLSPYDSPSNAREAYCFQTLDRLASNGSPQQQKLAEDISELILRNMRLNLGDYAHGGGGLTVGMALSVLGGAWNAAGSMQKALEGALGPVMPPMGTASRRQNPTEPGQSSAAESLDNYSATIAEVSQAMGERGNYSVIVARAREHIFAEAGSLWEHSLIPRLTEAAGPQTQDKLVTFGYASITGKDEKESAAAAFGDPHQTLHKVVVRVRMRTPADEKLDWYGWFPTLEPRNYVVVLVPQFSLLAKDSMSGDFTLWCDEGKNIEIPFATNSAPQLDRAYHMSGDRGGIGRQAIQLSHDPAWQAKLARNQKAAKVLDITIQKEVELEPRPWVGRRKLADALGKGQLFTGKIQGNATAADSSIPMSVICEPFETNSANIQITIRSGEATSFRTTKMKGHFEYRIIYGSVIAFNESGAQPAPLDNKGPFFDVNADGEVVYRTPYGKFPLKPVETKAASARPVGVTNTTAQ